MQEAARLVLYLHHRRQVSVQTQTDGTDRLVALDQPTCNDLPEPRFTDYGLQQSGPRLSSQQGSFTKAAIFQENYTGRQHKGIAIPLKGGKSLPSELSLFPELHSSI